MSENTKRLSQCDLCGAFINANIYGGVCNECTDKDKELYDQARTCLDFGERVLPEDLSAKSGVDIKHIKRWVRIGRLGSD